MRNCRPRAAFSHPAIYNVVRRFGGTKVAAGGMSFLESAPT
ncbi:hypothetical protein USDA257_c50370 [Sinorhizobium fredii USDA 257]|uniref:Uncharacterized protein n=1 Tax=Sinorhizobium fredii (strain USDA 257) TaxID=1185652 RepID=I3XCF8_SINF2|nr:hypothetical protein USDA257_c50370 [Sinorhizobium fredii USDA 257]